MFGVSLSIHYKFINSTININLDLTRSEPYLLVAKRYIRFSNTKKPNIYTTYIEVH